jgi:hypothetical protein
MKQAEKTFRRQVMFHKCGARHVVVIRESTRPVVCVTLQCSKCKKKWDLNLTCEHRGCSEWLDETRRFVYQRCLKYRGTAKAMLDYNKAREAMLEELKP